MVLSGPEAAKAKVRPLLEPLGRAVLGKSHPWSWKEFVGCPSMSTRTSPMVLAAAQCLRARVMPRRSD
jgi:hypothetical protein